MSGNTLIPAGMFGEQYAEDVAFLIKPKKILGEVVSKFQKSTIVETETLGRVTFQDGLIYIADKGSEAICEIYTHVPMQTGKPKKKILLIGAGDGLGVGRLLDYPSIEKVVAIDIDKDFVELADKVIPEGAKFKKDPRVEFLNIDGAEYVKNTKEKFDFILITVGDPYTISQTMFNENFIKDVYVHLSDDGIFCIDGFMPYYTNPEVLNYWDIFKLVASSFPITRITNSTSPVMPGGLVTFVIGSKKDDPTKGARGDLPVKTVWYNYDIHKACFVLPQFIREKLVGLKGFEQ